MKGKKVIVGVTGGIAAYKAAELVRLLVRSGADTQVVMTANATKFVTPLTFEALSGQRVIQDMWAPRNEVMDHIVQGQEADLIIVAPATANSIAKMANGLGDDFLSTMMLAATARVLLCPAMNSRMYQNPALRHNLTLLEERGYRVLSPEEGELACGTEGPGRLPSPEDIFELAEGLLRPQDLTDLRILVTAAATREPIDPVRYITNRSSGRMGYALAKSAAGRGADVTLVSGPSDLKPPMNCRLRPVKTTEEMREAVLEERPRCNVVIKAAAVLDYRPRRVSDRKIKKGEAVLTLELERTPDILAELGRTKEDMPCLLVGFAAETEDLLANAAAKLKVKNLDLIVANDVSRPDAGFDTETNLVTLLYRDGRREELPLITKTEVADHILNRVKELWATRA